MDRRQLTRNLGLFSFGTAFGLSHRIKSFKKSPTFLIISGWQTVNIGDIAHTPGLLSLIDKFYPEASYVLWPRDIEGYGVENMLKKHYPKLRILKTNKPGDTQVEMNEEIRSIFNQCDILLHGSGPHVLEESKIKLWKAETNKPYGVCGVTEQDINAELMQIIENSSFFFTRETASLAIVRNQIKKSIKTDFFPDATFALNIHDEEKAKTLLEEFDLEEKEFICIIPRLRFTPYYKIHSYVKWDDKKIKAVNDTNDKYKEMDHSKLRTVISRWVRETGKKVLICPEMSYQTEIMDELLIDLLPEDIKPFVHKKETFWITDEAASVYRRAFAIISMECHSPIISFANGTPAFYVRQKEDTIKGQMYYDIGLSDWVFEIDEINGEQVYSELRKLIDNYDIADKKISHAYSIINKQYETCFDKIDTVL